MSSPNELDRAMEKFKHEMDIQAELLNTKKGELAKLKQEETDFKQKNIDETKEVEGRKVKIKDDESRERKLLEEIRKIEEKQRQDHSKLASMASTDRTRLQEHGVKLDPHPHF